MCAKPPNTSSKFNNKGLEMTCMYKKRKTRRFRTIAPKCSQVRIKDQFEKITGIKMRPREKKIVEMRVRTT